MVDKNRKDQNGYTLVELSISLVVVGILVVGIFGLFNSLVTSAVFIKKQAIGLTLATNQMEYLKSLPYDNLAVVGGSIYHTSPLPSTTFSTLNGATYKTVTYISYVDDAFDGCGSYPSQQLKELYCRNYPPPSGSPATDLNPKDYKIINVSAFDAGNTLLAKVDTYVSARVAETSSTTGAVFINVIDSKGNPVPSATVRITNSTLSPAIDMSDLTDSNGTAIFYDLKPDTNNFDYVITATATGYSSLTTIQPPTNLQPNYPNQKVFTQQSSLLTMIIMPMDSHSLVIETTDAAGAALPNVKVYAKGGYKKYVEAADTSYYYDNFSPVDARPTTDSNGLASVSDLAPGTYIFCGDNARTNCTNSGTSYYLAAAVPYGGVNSLNPIIVPEYLSATPPTITYPYGGQQYMQKVRLILTTSSNFPRVTSIAPDEASQSSDPISNFPFQINGANLPCDSNASNCGTTVKLLQDSSVFAAACTGSSAGLQLLCTANISPATVGNTQVQISANGQTLTIPAGMLGGIDVVL